MKYSNIEAIPEDQCYGCGCCAAICQNCAIKMDIDVKGFLRPMIDVDKCNHCELCVSVCPVINKQPLYNLQDNVPFALWAEDSKIRLMASSGGAALLIALTFSRLGYSILGAIFDDDFRRIKHIVTDKPEFIIKTSGSKYVQSDSASAFKEAINFPQKKYVAFGTPCQISGLRSVIRNLNIESNYFLVDLFCHGVPSYLLWWAFIDELERNLGIIKHLELRNKAKGWQKHGPLAVGVNGIYAKEFTKDQFCRFFNSNYCLRQTCYFCVYGRKSDADLRLGDFWGEEFSSDFLGVSLGVPLNDKGLSLIKKHQVYRFVQCQKVG